MTDTPFKIVTDVIPIPGGSGRGTLSSPLSRAVYALATEAPIGASFFVPESPRNAAHAIVGRCHQLAGKEWASVRKVEGGCRVWKYAEPNMSALQRRYTLQEDDLT